MDKKLVFIVRQEKKDNGTITSYDFIGDKCLEKEMEAYFLEKTLSKIRYEK